MASKSTDISQIMFSVRVYQLLLTAYPIKFQQEYGQDMSQVFQDCCLRAVRQGGMNGMLKLWVVTLFDLIQSVLSEHAHKELEMKKEVKPEIRIAGWALIWGAVTFVISLLSLITGERFVISLNPNSAFFVLSGLLMIFVSTPLLVVGQLGVRNRYGDKVGWFGKNVLWLGAILGPLTSLMGFFTAGNSEWGWHLIYIGPGVLFTGLALFGIMALYKKPLPRWNIVPFLAGIWYPINIYSRTKIWTSTGDWTHGYPDFAMVAILDIMQGIALAALGYILLKSDVPEEIAVPA